MPVIFSDHRCHSLRKAYLSHGPLIANGTPSEVLRKDPVARLYGADVEILKGSDGIPGLAALADSESIEVYPDQYIQGRFSTQYLNNFESWALEAGCSEIKGTEHFA